jgi:hypothetical protein
MKERRSASGMKSLGMNNSLCFRALREGGGGTPETRKTQSQPIADFGNSMKTDVVPYGRTSAVFVL